MNSGVAFLNGDTETTAGRTVMVFGVGRGGTSAVAGMLRELGVSMGDSLHPLKHEWSPLVYHHDILDIDASALNIFAMNSKYIYWGWKSPRDIFSLDKYMHLVRNPRVIVVFRNMLDVLLSASRHEAMDLPPLANGIGQVFQCIGRLVNTTTVPTALISYERLRSHSRQVVCEINDWLGLNSDSARMETAAEFVSAENAEYRAVSSDAIHAKAVISQADLELDRSTTHSHVYPREAAALTEKTKTLNQEIELLLSDIEVSSHKLAENIRSKYPDQTDNICLASLSALLCKPIQVIEETIGFNPLHASVLPNDIEGAGEYVLSPTTIDGNQWAADYCTARARYKETVRKVMHLRRLKQIMEWRLRSI